MRINRKKQLILVFFCTLGASLFAQKIDHGIWSSLEVSKKFDNGLKLFLEEEYRLRNDLRTTDKFETAVGLEYGLGSFAKAGVSYSMINYFHPRNDEHEHNFFELRHRYNIYVEGEYSPGRFNFSLKERVQGTYRVLDSLTSAKTNPKYVLRSKASLSYNIKGVPLEPFAYIEFFNALEQGSDMLEFKSYRWSTGLKYSFNKKLSIKLGYLFTSDAESDESDRSNVLTIGFGYKL